MIISEDVINAVSILQEGKKRTLSLLYNKIAFNAGQNKTR